MTGVEQETTSDCIDKKKIQINLVMLSKKDKPQEVVGDQCDVSMEEVGFVPCF